MALGDLIGSVRKSKGLSMEECAARMGVSQPAWSDWENNKVAEPRRKTIEKIAAALEESADTFLAEAGRTTKSDPNLQLARRLERILRNAPPEKRSQIEAALERDAENYVSLVMPQAA